MAYIIPAAFKGMGIICFLYLGTMFLYCGFIPAFSWFWLLLGIAFFAGGTLLKFANTVSPGIGFWCSVLAFLAAAFGILFFSAAFFELSKAGNKKPSKGAEYVVVLGAKVNGKNPTKALKERIDAAFDYLEENPGAKAVLTGGKGRGEGMSESSCMERELIKKGILPSRLRKEEKSTTTQENIAYAKQWIPENGRARILVVTSDFHVKRGVAMAKDAGFLNVEGLGAPSSAIMRPHYYTREVLAWVKYKWRQI